MSPPMVAHLEKRVGDNYGLDTTAKASSAAAFLGIAWYLCLELNVRLFLRMTRRSLTSLYFWSTLICSWGICIHAVLIALADYDIWFEYSTVILITLFWCIFIVAHSVMLYTRLSLVLSNERTIRLVLYMIIFTGIVFGLGSVVIGIAGKQPTVFTKLRRVSFLWDKFEVAAFFIQETIIGVLYIRATSGHLKNKSLLGSDPKLMQRNMRNLIALNILIIVLDISLITICYLGYFSLMGFFKVGLYAFKLRAEFSILNALRTSIHASQISFRSGSTAVSPKGPEWNLREFNSNSDAETTRKESFLTMHKPKSQDSTAAAAIAAAV